MLTGSLVSAQVEDEMRELLSVIEQQKVASAAKVKQLATILQDMQAPGMPWMFYACAVICLFVGNLAVAIVLLVLRSVSLVTCTLTCTFRPPCVLQNCN